MLLIQVEKVSETAVRTQIRGRSKPLGKRIIVKNMHFGEQKTKGGIIILDDDGKIEVYILDGLKYTQ